MWAQEGVFLGLSTLGNQMSEQTSLIGVNNSQFYTPGSVLPKDRIYIYAVDNEGRAGRGSSHAAIHSFGAHRGHYAGLKGRVYAMALLSAEGYCFANETIKQHVMRLKKFIKKNPQFLFILGDISEDVPKDRFPEIAKLFMGIENCLYPESFRPYVDITLGKG